MDSLEQTATAIADLYREQLPATYEGRYSAIADATTVRTLLEGFRAGLNVKSACEAAGIHHDTLTRWLKRAEEHPDPDSPWVAFAAALKREKAAGQMELLNRLKKLGEKQWLPNAWLLERTDQEQFALKRDRDETGPKVIIQIGVSAPDVQVHVLPETPSRDE